MPSAGPQQQRIERTRSWLLNPQATKRGPNDPVLQALTANDENAIKALIHEETAKRRAELAFVEGDASDKSVNAKLTILMSLRKRPIYQATVPKFVQNLLAAGTEMDIMASEAHSLATALRWASMDPESVKWR